MALQLQTKSKLKIAGILTAAMALVAQPFAMVPFASVFAVDADEQQQDLEHIVSLDGQDEQGVQITTAEEVTDLTVLDENAAVVNPTINSVAPVLWNGANYKGINVDFRFKDVTGLQSASITVNRADGSMVTKTMKQYRIDWVNALQGAQTSLTIPFAIQDITLNEGASGSWSLPDSTIWNKTTVPQSVTVVFMFADREQVSLKADVNTKGIDYQSLLPPDTTAPIVTLQSGIEGSLNPTSYSVTATDDGMLDVIAAHLRNSDGVMVKNCSRNSIAESPYTLHCDVPTNLPDGEYNIRYNALDVEGNRSNTVTAYFMIDRTAPRVAITNPVAGQAVRGQVTIIGEVIDAHPMNSFMRITGPNGYTETNTRTDGAHKHELKWDTRGLADGEYTIRFEARDRAGNKDHRSQTDTRVRVDNTGPELTNITPTTGSATRSDFDVTIDASDPSGVQKIALNVIDTDTGKKVKEYAMKASNGDTWKTRVLLNEIGGEGNYDLRFRAVDNLGNVKYLNNRGGSYLVTVDTSAPTATINSPSDEATLEGLVQIQMTATDERDMAAYSYRIRNVETNALVVEKVVADGSELNSETVFAWNTRNYNNGRYFIYVSARDAAGNRSEQRFYVTVANSGPAVTIASPAAGQIANDSVDIVFSATDPSLLGAYCVKLNGGSCVEGGYRYHPVDGQEYTVSINTASLDEGMHTVTVRVTDRAGNVTEETVAISVRHTDSISPTEPTEPTEPADPKDPTNPANSTDEEPTGQQNNTSDQSDPRTGRPTTPVALGATTGLGQVVSPIITPTFGTLFGGQSATPADNEEDAADDTRVLGEQDEQPATATTADETEANDPEDGCWSFFGLCWYWWVLIVAALTTVAVVVRNSIASNETDTPGRRQ